MTTKSYKGVYKVRNKNKYRGNPSKVIFRSLWERSFMGYCDNNKNIVAWSSEEIVIPYRSPLDNQMHRYFPDFWIKVQDQEGKRTEYIVEIKPDKFTRKPKRVLTEKTRRPTKTYVREVMEYAKNKAKWEAAQAYCKIKGQKFLIITEKDIYGRNPQRGFPKAPDSRTVA